MYLSIKKFSNVKSHDEVINSVRNGLLPTVRNLPGFINCYATKFEDGDLGLIGLFGTKAEADKAAATASGWLKQNLAAQLPTDPMIFRGEVLLNAADKTVAKTA
jgi:hypothetical protein